MQLIRLPIPIVIAETVFPELVADLVNTKSVQNINNSLVQKLRVNMLICGVIVWLICLMTFWQTFMNFTHHI